MAPSRSSLRANGAHCSGQKKAKPTQGNVVRGIYHNVLPHISYAPAPVHTVHEARASCFPRGLADKLARLVRLQHMAHSGPRLLVDGARCCGQEKAKPT
jgi:hypothetical protein